MKLFTILGASAVLVSSTAFAATIDLTDNSFSDVTYVQFVGNPNATGPIRAFDETVDGTTFSFTASSNGQFRQVGTWGNGTSNVNGPFGLQFGGGGGNTASFELSVSEDVTLSNFVGMANGGGNVEPIFNVTGGAVSSLGNDFSTIGSLASGTPQTEMFVGGALSLVANTSYLFTTTNPGSNTVGFFTAFNFETVVEPNPDPVPLPAGAPLILAGLGALGLLRRRRNA